MNGYLDAPFFTEIDRRNVDLWLPLNDTLLKAAAEACAGAALSIAKHGLPVKQQAVFDLFAWTGTHADKLDDALHGHDSSLGDAKVIPAIADKAGNRWASISTVSIWPDGPFAVLKDQEVAKHVGARLVSGELDTQRVLRLQKITVNRIAPEHSRRQADNSRIGPRRSPNLFWTASRLREHGLASTTIFPSFSESRM